MLYFMRVITCDVCLLDFFDYQGFEETEKGIVCSFCIDEKEEDDERDEE
jgi:hypothetical protein